MARTWAPSPSTGRYWSSPATGTIRSPSTTHDADPAQLCSLLAEWSRTDKTYAQRITDLRNGGGLNGSVKLDDSSLIADAAVDTANGGGGNDLFFLNFTGLPTSTRDHTD